MDEAQGHQNAGGHEEEGKGWWICRESKRYKEEGGIVRSEKGIKRALLFPHDGKMNGEVVVWFFPPGVLYTHMCTHLHTPLLCLQRRLEQFHSVPQCSRAMCGNDERNVHWCIDNACYVHFVITATTPEGTAVICCQVIPKSMLFFLKWHSWVLYGGSIKQSDWRPEILISLQQILWQLQLFKVCLMFNCSFYDLVRFDPTTAATICAHICFPAPNFLPRKNSSQTQLY